MARLTVATLLPDLLGTYGDTGNGTVLTMRARLRGHEATHELVGVGDRVPEADVYLLGGGEDAPQVAACRWLAEHADLAARLADGAQLLSVCAGFQLCGSTYVANGAEERGLGLLDVRTLRGRGRRAVGEVAGRDAAGLNLPWLSGFENHAGRTALGDGVVPLATVLAGVGNGASVGTEGAVAGRVVATYLHGPVLARNPALADLLLSRVDPELAEGELELAAEQLREERRRSLGLSALALR